MKIIAIALAAALSGCATTYQTASGPLECQFFGSDDPANNAACVRAEYQGYADAMTPDYVHPVVMDHVAARAACSKLTDKDAVACAAWQDGQNLTGCIVILPAGFSMDMLWHEVAHCRTGNTEG